jgi:hypothetical protein
MYASAQALDFLARTKNTSFPNRKLQASHPVFPDGHYLGKPFNPVLLRNRVDNSLRKKRLRDLEVDGCGRIRWA